MGKRIKEKCFMPECNNMQQSMGLKTGRKHYARFCQSHRKGKLKKERQEYIKSINYVGIHKTMHSAKFHQTNRELKTKKDSTRIKVGWLTFDGNDSYEKGYQDARNRDKFPD